jgi:hypothetical protein
LALRFIIAYVVLPGSGFPNDLGAFQAWANDIAQHGPIGFYDRAGFIDYPPVYLLLLGLVSFLTGGNIGDGVKYLPMLADLGLAAVVWVMVRELGVSGRRAFIAALIVVVNPVTWFNSAIWGQADAVGSILLLLGLRELQKDRREAASVLAVLAALTKLQLGVLGFVVAFVVLRRSLAPKTGEPSPERVLTSLGAGLITVALVCLPFTGLDLAAIVNRLGSVAGLLTLGVAVVAGIGAVALGRRYLPIADSALRDKASLLIGAGTTIAFAGMVFDSIVSHLVNTFGEYPYLTLNAYNPWSLVGDSTGAAMDRSLNWIHDAPWSEAASGINRSGFIVGPFPFGVSVLALLVAAVLGAAAVLAWRSQGVTAETDGSAAVVPPVGAGRGGRVGHWVHAELHSLWGAFAVAAAVIGVVVALSLTGSLYAATLGSGMLIAVILGVSAWAAWRDDQQSLLVALAILTIAFFVVPTRVHERYLFPFFGLGAILLAASPRWRVVYGALAVVNAANLLAVLVQYTDLQKNTGIPISDGQVAGTLIDWGRGLVTATWFDGIIWPIALSGVVTGLAMVWALLQMRDRAAQALARETLDRATDPSAPSWWTALGEAEPVELPGVAMSASTSISSPYDEPDDANLEGSWAEDDEPYGAHANRDTQPRYVPSWVMSLWHRLSRSSSQPDRSAALNAEPRGRLDKLDIWVVVALILAILSMRVYRLGEPAQMHFDEVYHARTATEFLQDFRYNIPHDVNGTYIYEWTHPHFAKYAIAGSITLFSDDKVTSTGSLNVPVKDVLVQPRTATSPSAPPPTDSEATTSYDVRYGDRVLVATGSDVKVYDLQTRALTYTYSIAGASAFSEVGPSGLVYVGTTDGRIYRLDTTSLDDVRQGLASAVKPAVALDVTTGLSITHVYTGLPPYVLASDATGNIVSIDLTTSGGTIVGRGLVPGAADFAKLGTGPSSVLADPTGVTNASAEAQVIASVLGIDVEPIQSALSTSGGLEVALPVGSLSSDQIVSLSGQIMSGELPGITVSTSNPQVLVAYRDGVGVLDARHVVFDPARTIPTDSPATSIAINSNTSQDSYVTAGDSMLLLKVNSTDGTASVTKSGSIGKMPGVVTKVVLDNATKIAHALGRTPDGSGWTVYAIETNGDAVFSDAKLPFEPVAIGLDSSPQMPDVNHEALLAFAPDGSMASVDVGQFAFSWRLVGVLFGTLMAVCMYLLARILFRRRTVGLLVAAFTLMDGMLFAQSRIAMNDTYVGGLLLLAYVIFALLWLDGGKRRYAFWLGMPVLGVVLGLALSAKWVALYAIASIGVLILIRSALGRLLTILGLAAGTGVLGYMAIAEMKYAPGTGNVSMTALLILAAVGVVLAGTVWVIKTRLVPDKVFAGISTAVVAGILLAAALTFSPGSLQNGAPNYTFFIIMLAVTSLAAAANAYHPVAWSREELYFAVGAPVAIGLLVGALGLVRGSGPLLEVGVGGCVLGMAAGVAFYLGGRVGFGPLAVPPRPGSPASFAEPATPAPTGWLRLGSGFGLPAAWMSLCLLVLPIVVYIVMYVPWAMPWQPQIASGPTATGNLPVFICAHPQPDPYQTEICPNGDGWPSGHTGQTLWGLTQSMYNYHNDLRASHAASSPWWAWPLDLKPVWFDSGGDVPGMSAWIHDGGNPALWWMAIFGMAFICWQAFKRRSLGLTLIAVAFFWQWLSWARIDRAAFQYHFYTALPFFLMALAYFLAELWHGPSRRTWLLARVAAAAALLFPGVMWLLKPAMCGLARVDTGEYFGNTACGTGTGDVVITSRMFLIAVVVIVALVALSAVLWRLERRQEEGIEDHSWILQLLAPVALGLGAVAWLSLSGPNDVLIHAALPPDLLAIFLGLLGLVMSYFALTARNPRHFVLGVCVIAVMVFLALYPDLSGLWLPSKIIGIYYAPLPTWLYGFQFSVNLQPSAAVGIGGTYALSFVLVALFVACVAAGVAWERRIVVGWRRSRLLLGPDSAAPAGSAASDGATGDSKSNSPASTKDSSQSKGTDVS